MILLGLVFLPIVIGLIGYILGNRQWPPLQGIAVQVALVIALIYLAQSHHLPYEVNLLGSKPPVGMLLRVDKLSFFLLVLTNSLFLLLHIFAWTARYYEKKFIFLFLSLQGLINGIFLSTDLFNIYLILEVATVVASILIMYKKDSKSINDGMIYLMSNMIAMTFFLMGLGYLYKMFGVLSFDAVRTYSSAYSVSQMALPIAFLLTGVSLKSAILPLSSWLPKAHGTASAPIVVSAVLSSIFVKTGVYIFIRMQQLLFPNNEMGGLLLVIGVLTALAGVLLALVQVDIKLIWAYSTVSQMGWIMVGLNSGTAIGIEGAKFHILAHALYKTVLFLSASHLISIYGTRNINEMRGLTKRAWPVALPLFVSLLSMTGAPMTIGYISKHLLKQSIYDMVPQAFIFGLSILSSTYLIRFMPVLFGKTENPKRPCAYKMRWNQILPLWVLSGFSLIFPLLRVNLLEVSLWKEHLIEYGLVLFGGSLLYFMLSRTGEKYFHKVRKFDLTFNSLAFMILVVFVALLQYTSRMV